MNTRLIVCLVDGSRFQRRKDFLRLGVAFIGANTSHLHQLEFLAYTTYDHRGIVEPHHNQTAKLPICLRGHANLGRHRKLVSRCLLEQQIGYFPEILPILRQFIGENTEGAKSSRNTELLVIIGMPLPLFAQRGQVKLIAFHGVHYHVRATLRHDKISDRLAIDAHDGPSSRPVNGIQMYHTAISLLILKMQKPVFAVFRMYPTTLMRTIDFGFALCQDNLMFIRAIR